MRIVAGIAFTLVFLTACSKQPPSPEYITINKDGTVQRGTNKIDHAELGKLIRKRRQAEGSEIPIYFISDKATPFPKVKETMQTIMDTMCGNFQFQMLGSSKVAPCTPYPLMIDEPIKIEIIVEVKNDELYVDNKKMKVNEIKELVKKKPAGADGYRVIISCLDDSSFGTIYEVIEACNKSKYTRVEVSVLDELPRKK